MTHFNHKEEEFRKILGDLELGIDTDTLWNEVQHRLPQSEDDQKLPFAIWFLGAFFLLGMLGLLFLGPDQVPQAPIYSEENIITTTASDNEIYAAVKEYEQAIDKVASEKANSANNNEDLKIEDGLGSIANSSNRNTNTVQSTTTSFSTSHQPIINTTTPNNSNFNNLLSSSEEIPETPLNSAKVIASSRELKTIQSAGLAIDPIAPVAILRSNLLSDGRTEITLDKQIAVANSIQPLESESWVPRYSVAIGPNLGLTSYGAALSDVEPAQGYVTRQPINEAALPGFSSQLSYGFTRNGWQVEAGLNYSMLAARYIDDNLGVTTQEINSATGGTVSESTVFQNDIRLHRIHNNLDLSVGVGRELFANENYKIYSSLAASYNIFSNNSGYYQDVSEMLVTKLADTTEEIYNNRSGVGGQISLSIERRLFNSTSLIIRPYYSRYLSPINKNTTSFKIENSQVGLLIGISYRPVWE